MSDIIKRLNRAKLYTSSGEVSDLPEEAADTITRLTAEVERLRSMTVVQETLIRKADEEVERLRAAIQSALRQLADGNRVLATDTLARVLT